MKTFSFIQALYLALYSKSFYQDVGRRWKGLGLTYLLLIIIVGCIPKIINLHNDFAEFIDKHAPYYIKQVPKITISKGEASITEPTPYYIYAPDKTSIVAIIDTSGTIHSLKNTKALILLTKKEIIVRTNGSKTQSLSLADFGDMVVDKNFINRSLESVSSLFAVIIFPFSVFFEFLLSLIQMLFCAMIGVFIARKFSVRIDYRSLVRLSVAAYTPAVILQAAHAVLKIPFPYSMLISLCLTLGYLVFALSTLEETEKQELAKS